MCCSYCSYHRGHVYSWHNGSNINYMIDFFISPKIYTSHINHFTCNIYFIYKSVHIWIFTSSINHFIFNINNTEVQKVLITVLWFPIIMFITDYWSNPIGELLLWRQSWFSINTFGMRHLISASSKTWWHSQSRNVTMSYRQICFTTGWFQVGCSGLMEASHLCIGHSAEVVGRDISLLSICLS